MNITQDLTRVNYEKGNRGRKYIVLHYTGNQTDTAAGNANYFRSANRGASAHYFVDKTQIVQVVRDEDTAWAVGRNYGRNNLFGSCTNYNSISIEMCSDGGEIAEQTFRNTVGLTKQLMKKYSIPAERVLRHWDVCSKVCPGWNGWGVGGKDASIWNQFKAALGGSAAVTPDPLPPTCQAVHTDYAVMIAGGRRLPYVRDMQDYAGIPGKYIVGLIIKCTKGYCHYRVHRKGKSWLPYVDSRNANWSDQNNGWAGDGKTPIDAVEVYYYTPDNIRPYRRAKYRVSPVGGGYYDWQYDNEKDKQQDGWAGSFGKEIGRFPAVRNKSSCFRTPIDFF